METNNKISILVELQKQLASSGGIEANGDLFEQVLNLCENILSDYYLPPNTKNMNLKEKQKYITKLNKEIENLQFILINDRIKFEQGINPRIDDLIKLNENNRKDNRNVNVSNYKCNNGNRRETSNNKSNNKVNNKSYNKSNNISNTKNNLNINLLNDDNYNNNNLQNLDNLL